MRRAHLGRDTEQQAWRIATRWSSSEEGRWASPSAWIWACEASRARWVERYPEPQRIPKGQNLSQRTLEHFYFWGIVDELRAARVMPNNYPIGGVTAYKHLMSDYWYTPPGRETVQSFYYEENDRLPQYRTEAVLRAKIATLPSVTTYFGWTADSIEQDTDGVRVSIAETGATSDGFAWEGFEPAANVREDATGERRTIAAAYVVGCDGARSFVVTARASHRAVRTSSRRCSWRCSSRGSCTRRSHAFPR